jgi:hypothetical protein
MLKLFQHEEQATEEEEQIETFEKEIEKLKAEKAPTNLQMNTLHGKILAEPYFPEKRRMQTERGKLAVKSNKLQAEIDSLREKQAHPKIVYLFKSNLDAIKVTINGNRIEIDKNLDVVIPFSGCNHTKKVPVFELLRIQSTLKTNLQLLSTWEINLRNGYGLSRSLLCQECMQEKRKKLEKDHTYSPHHRTGQANIQISISSR